MNFNAQRRRIISFLGYGALLGNNPKIFSKNFNPDFPFITAIPPSRQDDLRLADGLHYDILIRWRDQINANEQFGFPTRLGFSQPNHEDSFAICEWRARKIRTPTPDSKSGVLTHYTTHPNLSL